VVQTLRKLHDHEYYFFGRNVSQHQTNCTLRSIISLFHAVHTSSGYLDLFYADCTDQITVRLLVFNELFQEGSGSDVMGMISFSSSTKFSMADLQRHI
jgi:hypothetical protein